MFPRLSTIGPYALQGTEVASVHYNEGGPLDHWEEGGGGNL